MSWICKGCRQPIPWPSPSYCSATCIIDASARRRATAARRSRERRRAINQAAMESAQRP